MRFFHLFLEKKEKKLKRMYVAKCFNLRKLFPKCGWYFVTLFFFILFYYRRVVKTPDAAGYSH